jgi:hypothetical protein
MLLVVPPVLLQTGESMQLQLVERWEHELVEVDTVLKLRVGKPCEKQPGG